jgi:hypothetical protein
MWVISFTPLPPYPRRMSPLYPLDRRLGGPQSRSGRYGESSWPYRDSNYDSSVVNLFGLVTINANKRRAGFFLACRRLWRLRHNIQEDNSTPELAPVCNDSWRRHVTKRNAFHRWSVKPRHFYWVFTFRHDGSPQPARVTGTRCCTWERAYRTVCVCPCKVNIWQGTLQVRTMGTGNTITE